MKKNFLSLVLVLCLVGCNYPDSDISNVAVNIESILDKPNKTVILTANFANNSNKPVTECGFCYAGYGGRDPIFNSNRIIVSENDFTWGVGKEMRSRVGYVRAYIVVDGIVIYSERTIGMGLLYANVDI